VDSEEFALTLLVVLLGVLTVVVALRGIETVGATFTATQRGLHFKSHRASNVAICLDWIVLINQSIDCL
jgi:hypothetical protein